MENYKHCSICENSIMDMKVGLKCRLTNQKPRFEFRCEKHSFKTRLFKNIEKIHLKIKLINRKKFRIYTRLFILLFFSLCFIVGGVLFLLEELIFTASTVIGTGVSILTVAMFPFVKYSHEVRDLKRKKEEIKKLLNIYNITYTVNFDIQNYYKNMHKVESKISLFKNSSILDTYQNSFDYFRVNDDATSAPSLEKLLDTEDATYNGFGL